MIAMQDFVEIEKLLLERRRAIESELAELDEFAGGNVMMCNVRDCRTAYCNDAEGADGDGKRGGKKAQLVYASRGADGKRKRTRVDEDATEVKAVMRRLYLTEELALVEKNMRAIQQAKSDYFDYTIDDVLARMPEKFGGLPETYFLLGVSASSDGMRLAGKEGVAADGTYGASGCGLSGGLDVELDAWARAPYQQSDYMPEGREHTTSRGLKVRSKSEAAICEALYKFGVPFRYEEELAVGRHKYAPDFVVRSRKTGKLFYWEHCGLTSSREYMERHYRKMQDYEEFGIVPWDNLIVTYDGEGGTLNLAWIEAIIRCHLV